MRLCGYRFPESNDDPDHMGCVRPVNHPDAHEGWSWSGVSVGNIVRWSDIVGTLIWNAFCAGWFMLSWAAIVGKE